MSFIETQNSSPSSARLQLWNNHVNASSTTLAQNLITKLARGLYLAGAPLYAVELRIQDVANALNLPLTILALPCGIVIAYGSGDNIYHWPITHIISTNQGTNMGRLYDLDRFAKTLSGSTTDLSLYQRIRDRILKSVPDEDLIHSDHHGQITTLDPINIKDKKSLLSLRNDVSPTLTNFNQLSTFIPPTLSLSPIHLQAYSDELDAILSSKDTFPPWLNVLCQGTTGMLLSALWIPVTPWDLMFTFSMGIIHGLMLRAEQKYNLKSMDVGIPIVIAILARLLELAFGSDRVCFATLAVMSSFSYFPGVPITLAMVEFAAHNTMTGVVRLLDAFLRIFKLGFGMVMGASIASAIYIGEASIGDTMCMSTRRPNTIVIKSMYSIIPIVAIPLVCGMNVVLKAKLHQFGWMVLVGGVSLATYLIALFNDVDPGMSASICAMVASMLSQGLAKKYNHVGIATLIAGLIWLNPGPPFIRGAMHLLTQNVQSSVAFASEAAIRALSIVLGLYVSRLLMTPLLRRTKGGQLADLSA